MRPNLRPPGLVHLRRIGQSHVSGHLVILPVLALPLGIAQQRLSRLQLCRPVGQPFTVHLVVINPLALLRDVARLSDGLVQSTLDSRHNGVCLA